MTAALEVYRIVIIPGCDQLTALGGPARSTAAERLLLAISGQEADWAHRVQRSKTKGGQWFDGPARGLWQFERGGGVRGVLSHPDTQMLASRLCEARGVPPVARAVHDALATDDLLACGFARLLLWSDPHPLPETRDGGWAYYLRNWRPGKPHPDRWPACWRTACDILGAP